MTNGRTRLLRQRGGRIEPSNLISRILKPPARGAGLGEWVGFHTFRHTCATALFRAGWNAVQVQRFLGHHKASFTLDTYTCSRKTCRSRPSGASTLLARPLSSASDPRERLVRRAGSEPFGHLSSSAFASASFLMEDSLLVFVGFPVARCLPVRDTHQCLESFPYFFLRTRFDSADCQAPVRGRVHPPIVSEL
jgi:hypothetical protein